MDEVTLQLDFGAAQPLFAQLYQQIRREISQGLRQTGEKLPSKRSLAAFLRCSQNTVQAAYDQLVDEGWLEARPKSGYYVAALEDLLNLGPIPRPAEPVPEGAGSCRYDFTPFGVDAGTFPFAQWRRLGREILSARDETLLRAGHPQGLAELRVSIGHYLFRSRGVRCSPDQILISSGTEYLLQLLIQLLEQSTGYAIENPGYEKLAMIFSANRVKIHGISLDEQGMDPRALAASGAQVACVTPSHQFPTGRVMPVSRRIQLMNWAVAEPDRYLVEDDYDSEFRYGGKPIPSLQSLDEQDRVVYMGTFSKSLSPALRVSYMVLPPALIQAYRERLNFYLCPVPVLEQKILHGFLKAGHFERHLNRVRSLYRQKRETLIAALAEVLPRAGIQGDAAGLHLTLTPNCGLSEAELIAAARAKGIGVYGLSQFYSDGPHPETATLVLGFATLPLAEIHQAVVSLGAAFNE